MRASLAQVRTWGHWFKKKISLPSPTLIAFWQLMAVSLRMSLPYPEAKSVRQMGCLSTLEPERRVT